MLMSYMRYQDDDGTLGLNGGHQLTSKDVAEDLGLTENTVRKALLGLCTKGIIEAVGRGVPGRPAVYRLFLPREHMPDSHVTRAESGTLTKKFNKSSQESRLINNQPMKKAQVVRLSSPWPEKPKHPYPRDTEEVYSYASGTVDKGEDIYAFVLVTDTQCEDFFKMNENKGWRYPSGEPIYDWHAALR